MKEFDYRQVMVVVFSSVALILLFLVNALKNLRPSFISSKAADSLFLSMFTFPYLPNCEVSNLVFLLTASAVTCFL